MANGYRPYEKPGVRQLDHVAALLLCWSDWRGTVRQVMRLRYSPRCNLGRLVRLGRSTSEMWEHNRVESREIFDDEMMSHVDRLVCALPEKQRQAVRLTYVEGRNRPVWWRAKRMKVEKSQYYAHLKAAHEVIDGQVDWRKVGTGKV